MYLNLTIYIYYIIFNERDIPGFSEMSLEPDLPEGSGYLRDSFRYIWIMNRFIASFLFLFMAISARGQDISRYEADSLLRSLSKAGADTARINSLLKLALFEIHKPGELKRDLDSAAAFLNQAKQINVQVKSITK